MDLDAAIDLCSSSTEMTDSKENNKPPGVPLPKYHLDHDGAIVIVDSEDEEEEEDKKLPAVQRPKRPPLATATNHPAASIGGGNKRIKTAEGVSATRAFRPIQKHNRDDDDDDDDDLDDEDYEEEGLCIVGTKGTNVLADFPHSREHCVLAPIDRPDADPFKICSQCYCYVCDVPAKECKLWRQHCHARHKDSHWQKERERVRLAGGPDKAYYKAPSQAVAPPQLPAAQLPPPPPPPPPPPAAAAAAAAAATAAARLLSSSWVPPVVAAPTVRANRPAPTDYSVAALLNKVTSVYPSETVPPATVRTELRHYQKQAIAFMQAVERSADESVLGTVDSWRSRGGWLSAEVGMGKTLVAIGLVSLDASAILPPLPQNQNNPFFRQGNKDRIKATLVVTSVSLMGQWEDEVRKHAPTLKCYRFHPSSRSSYGNDLCSKFKATVDRSMIKKADIIIGSATFDIRARLGRDYVFNRIIVDESHLFGSSSIPLRNIQFIISERRWCCTATPCVSSTSEMHYQLLFLGLHNKNTLLRSALDGTPAKFWAAVDLLRMVMVRHRKSQQINGAKALALPESSTRIQKLAMTTNERSQYNARRAEIQRTKLQQALSKGIRTSAFQLVLDQLMSGVTGETKVQALVTDIQEGRRQNPNIRVVVFTQYKTAHEACVRELKRASIQTFKFSGSTAASQRDKAIRQFQSPGGGAMAFVITLRAGSVGMTLTAASRVYLMEPCLNPATEIQAAGRINRLGQKSNVEVIKFAFRDSVETNILRFHKKLSKGSTKMDTVDLPAKSVKILIKDV